MRLNDELAADIVAVFIQHHRRTCDINRVGARAGLCPRSFQTAHGVGLSVHRDLKRTALRFRAASAAVARNAAHAVRFAVIQEGSARCRHIQLKQCIIRSCNNRQCSELGQDPVVEFLCAAGQRVPEGVLSGSDHGAAAGHIIDRAFAFREAVARNRDALCSQRRSVVDPAVAGRSQNHFSRLDGQLAVLCRHTELLRHIISFFVRDSRRTGHRNRVGSGICSAAFCRQAADLIRLSFHPEGSGDQAVYGVLLSVVECRQARTFHRDAVKRIPVQYSQRSLLYRNVIILLLCSLAQLISKGISAAAGHRLRAGHFIVGTFAGREAVARDLDFAGLQLRAVVFLLCALRSQADISLPDRQASLQCPDDEFVRHIPVLIIHNLCGSGDPDRISSGIRLFRFCLKSAHLEALSAELEVQPVKAFCRVCLTVVQSIRALCLHRDLVARVPVDHGQRSVGHFNVIVVCVCVLFQRVAEGVPAAAGDGLFAGHFIVGAFTLGKTVLFHHDGIRREFASVILPLDCGGAQQHLSLSDDQSARLHRHFKLTRHIPACRIGHHRRAFNLCRVNTGIHTVCPLGHTADLISLSVHNSSLGNEAFHRLFPAVIDGFEASALQHCRILLAAVEYGQLSEDRLDPVIVFIGSFLQVVGEGVR